MADVPHLAFPLRFAGGAFATVEQGTPEHILQQAEIVVRTRPGTLEAQPEFGLRELVGTLGPVAPRVQSALDEFVPDRALLTTEDTSRIDERIRRVLVDLGPEETE